MHWPSSRTWRRSRREVRPLLSLAMPIVAGMLAQMLIGLADTIMVGRVGVVPLAAAAFVNTLTHLPLVFSLGLLSSISVLGSHAFGAQARSDAGEVLRHGVVLAAASGLASAVLLTLLTPFLAWFGQPPEVVAAARTYLVLFGWSLLPALIAQALKQYSEALNRPWPPAWIMLAGVVLNIFLNWIFIYGHFGFPALGLEGAGWASLAARTAVMVALWAYVLRAKSFAEYRPAQWRTGWSVSWLRRFWTISWPAAAQHLLEVSAFAFAALMTGWISAEAMAAHQIAITCAATTFMFPLGIGIAACIRVGHAWGASHPWRARPIGYTGVALAGGVMGLFALMFVVAGGSIASLFVAAPGVVDLAARLLMVAAVFQVADGVQVVAISALRGMTDVRVPALIAVVAYWTLAVPVAYLLAFPARLGAVGIWIGLALGLGVAAAALTSRFHVKTGRVAREARQIRSLTREDRLPPLDPLAPAEKAAL